MKQRTGTLNERTAVLSLILAMALMGTSAAHAGPEGGAFPSPGMGAPPLSAQLELTAEQQEQIRTIMASTRAEHERIQMESRQRIEAVLTDEQKAKRDAAVKASLDARMAAMQKQLDLSDEQVATIESIFQQQQRTPEMSPSQVRDQIIAVLTPEQQAKLKGGVKGPPQPAQPAPIGHD